MEYRFKAEDQHQDYKELNEFFTIYIKQEQVRRT